MFRKTFVFSGPLLVAGALVALTPQPVQAAPPGGGHGGGFRGGGFHHGGFHRGVMPRFRGGFDPRFNHSFFAPRVGRGFFDPRFNRRFFFDPRFDPRFNRGFFDPRFHPPFFRPF